MLILLASPPRMAAPALPPEQDRQGRHLLSPGAWNQLCRLMRLSTRELQILQYVFDDAKAYRIAFELGLSTHTVNTYFQRLYRKLHVDSRPQLIMKVMAEYLSHFRNGCQ
jgi:DNA-binding NarL/FixJ family response regulator